MVLELLRRSFLLLAVVSVIFTSCRKDRDDNPRKPPPPDSSLVFMNTGFIWNTLEQHYDACYWLNEKFFRLAAEDGESAFAYGFTTQGSSKYIAGTYSTFTEPDISYPCYWKNGVKKNLPVAKFEEFVSCTARDIITWNEKFYILGSLDLKPVLWILSGDAVINYFQLDTQYRTRTASNFILYQNKIYIGGDKANVVNGAYEYEVGYWTVDASGRIDWHSIEKKQNLSTTFSLTVNNAGVFIAGEKRKSPAVGTAPEINLWGAMGSISLTPVDDPKPYRFGEIHSTSKGEMYSSIFDFKNKRPVVWKINKAGNIIDKIFPPIEAGKEGYANSIAISGERIAISGYYFENSEQRVWLYKDGKLTFAEVPEKTLVTLTFAEWVSI